MQIEKGPGWRRTEAPMKGTEESRARWTQDSVELETFWKAVVGKCKKQSYQEWDCGMWGQGLWFKVLEGLGSLCEAFSKWDMTKFAFLKTSPDGGELLKGTEWWD